MIVASTEFCGGYKAFNLLSRKNEFGQEEDIFFDHTESKDMKDRISLGDSVTIDISHAQSRKLYELMRDAFEEGSR